VTQPIAVNPQSSDAGRPNVGAIAGGIAGGVTLVVIIAIVFLLRRRRAVVNNTVAAVGGTDGQTGGGGPSGVLGELALALTHFRLNTPLTLPLP
jgi:hypothetical protein